MKKNPIEEFSGSYEEFDWDDAKRLRTLDERGIDFADVARFFFARSPFFRRRVDRDGEIGGRPLGRLAIRRAWFRLYIRNAIMESSAASSRCGRRATTNERSTMPRYRLDELPQGQTDWARLDREPDLPEAPDEENPAWTAQAFAEADLFTPGGLKRTPVYIRMYQAVLDYYRSFGKGYQTRINNDLLELVRRRQRQSSRIHPIRQRPVRVVRGTQSWEGRASTPRAG